jgi:O-antigen/teichoic acid export membrane protein
MTGYQWLGFVTNLLGVGLLVGMVWWLTPLYGVTGAAVGLATGMTVANLIRLALVRRVLGINPMSLAMFKSVAAALVATAVAWGASHWLGLTGRESLAYLAPVLLGLTLLAFAVYAGMVWLLGFEPSDRQAAQTIADRLRGRSAPGAEIGTTGAVGGEGDDDGDRPRTD